MTRPIEEAVRTVPGVQDVRSETTRGSAQISIDFGWGRDMVASTLLVDAAIARAVAALPAGVTYAIIAGLLLQYPLVLIVMPVLVRLTLPRDTEPSPDDRIEA